MSAPIAYRALKLQAIVALLLGRHARADALFDRMLARWPEDGYALASRAHRRAATGRRDDAIADLETLVRLHPERAAADWFNLGFLLESAGRLETAQAAFRRALALDPRLDRAWYGLGVTLIRLGRADDALPALQRNTELQPMSPYGWYQLARLHAEQRRADEARRIIRHLKGFEPKVAAQLERETGLAA